MIAIGMSLFVYHLLLTYHILSTSCHYCLRFSVWVCEYGGHDDTLMTHRHRMHAINRCIHTHTRADEIPATIQLLTANKNLVTVGKLPLVLVNSAKTTCVMDVQILDRM